MKILHTADWHSRDKDIDEIRKCLEFLVAEAREEQPDLIIHAGDIWDSRDVKLDTKAVKLAVRTISELADIAPFVTVTGTHSHEATAPEILSMVRGQNPIHVSTQPEQIYLLDGRFTGDIPEPPYEPEIILSMVPQPTKEYFARTTQSSISESDQEIGGLLGAIFAGFGGMAAQWRRPHVLVGHFTVKGSVTSTGQQLIGREIEVSREHLELARADLVCLGHIHKAQEVAPNVFYSGSIYRENWGEQEEKGFWLHGWEDGQPWSEFVETPTKKLLRAPADLTLEDVLSTDSALYMHMCSFSDQEIKDASVRVELKVWQDEAAKISKEGVEALLKDQGAAEVDIRIIRVPRETVRSANIMKLHSLRDKIQELASTRGEEVAPEILEKADQLEAGGVA
ncbi:MAG: metallophosphoesterase [Pseudomonadota bacterium]